MLLGWLCRLWASRPELDEIDESFAHDPTTAMDPADRRWMQRAARLRAIAYPLNPHQRAALKGQPDAEPAERDRTADPT
jgi:hypothetical protein